MKIIILSDGSECFVDDDDFSLLSQHKWQNSNGYAARNVHRSRNSIRTSKILYMHRAILNLSDREIECDHINRNRLDNRKFNLRAGSKSQNHGNVSLPSHNTSGFKGVAFHGQAKKWNLKKPWVAAITVNQHRTYLGMFDTAKNAAIAYDKAAILTFGEFSKTNAALGLL